jgi:ribosomal protein S13
MKLFDECMIKETIRVLFVEEVKKDILYVYYMKDQEDEYILVNLSAKTKKYKNIECKAKSIVKIEGDILNQMCHNIIKTNSIGTYKGIYKAVAHAIGIETQEENKDS